MTKLPLLLDVQMEKVFQLQGALPLEPRWGLGNSAVHIYEYDDLFNVDVQKPHAVTFIQKKIRSQKCYIHDKKILLRKTYGVGCMAVPR